MGCFLINDTPQIKIDIVYVYPMSGEQRWTTYAQRFVDTYKQNPPGIQHNTIIMCNGYDAKDSDKALFAPLQNLNFVKHYNTGWDIGAFQKAAKVSSADMIVFFGSSAYVQGEGWLARMTEAFLKNPTLQYGSMGNRGEQRLNIYPHIRTTGFWMQPALLNSYPITINNPADRFPFEHGKNCLTEFLKKVGIKSIVVTWAGEYTWENWDVDTRGFNRGDQGNLLSGDRICDLYKAK